MSCVLAIVPSVVLSTKDLCREMPDGGFASQGVARGERHAQKPVDKILETDAHVCCLTFFKPGGNIRL